jgi:phage tail sheath gpL-like
VEDAVRRFEAKSKADTAQAASQAKWDAAVEKHGNSFPDLMSAACAVAPQGMQLAISGMKDWDTLAVHLAKNPAQLKELAAEYAANPFEATARLGRIRDALISKEPVKAAATKPLPEPLAVVGGTASASGQSLQDTLESGSMSQLRAVVKKARGE